MLGRPALDKHLHENETKSDPKKHSASAPSLPVDDGKQDWLARFYLARHAELPEGDESEHNARGRLHYADLSDDDDRDETVTVESALTLVRLARALTMVPDVVRDIENGDPTFVIVEMNGTDELSKVKEVFQDFCIPASVEIVNRVGKQSTKPRAYFHEIDGIDIKSRKKDSETTLRRAVGLKITTVVLVRSLRDLPNFVMRAADAVVKMPNTDDSAIGWALTAVFAKHPMTAVPADVAARADVIDILVASRRAKDPDDAIDRLVKLVLGRGEASKQSLRLGNLHGYGLAKDWGMDLSNDMRSLREGKIAWRDVDNKGLLLSGPPGTGKTTFAVAVAAEAGIPLVATSVAQWLAMGHLGDTLRAMRQSFAEARQNAPCILFIDELDGIGDRNTLTGDHVEYWLQVVNCLLEELSGVQDRDGVVVLGASNHPERIDAAVLRAGRLDRHIRISLPDADDLAKIIRHHLRNDLADVDLMPIAQFMAGSSGADVEAMIRRARASARRAQRDIEFEDLVEVVQAGLPDLTAEDRRLLSIHEAGHAVVIHLLTPGTLHMISIRMVKGGAVHRVDKQGAKRAQDLEDEIVILLAGRAAEEVVFGSDQISLGGYDDLAKATRVAIAMETEFGFGAFSSMSLASMDDRTLLMIPEVRLSVMNRLEACRARAIELVRTNRVLIEVVAAALDGSGVLTAAEFEMIARRCQTKQSDDPARSAPSFDVLASSEVSHEVG